MADNSEEQDIYVAQLREVFESCDVRGDGLLSRNELVDLCQKLQLEDQVEKLVAQLLGDQASGEVNFEQFKEGFVVVLSEAIDGLTMSSGDEQPEEAEVPPKAIVNDKRYGRRSRPFDTRLSDNGSADEGDIESINSSRPGSPDLQPSVGKQRKVGSLDETDLNENSKERRLSRVNSQKLRRRESIRKRDSVRRQESMRRRDLPETPHEEVLEASGQISNNSGKWASGQPVESSALNSPTEEQQLRTIWNEVNVGANGYLDKHELSVVCEHIGMQGMDEDELSLLFNELDDDRDGQVSFEEFLHGLFIAKDKSQSESDHSAAINLPESPRSRASNKVSGEPMTSTMTRTMRTVEANLFQALDPRNTGVAKLDDIRDLWQAQENTAALEILKLVEVDSESKVSLSQLTVLLEASIYDKSDSLCQAVVSIFKHELSFMRNQVEMLNNEKEKLLENASNLVNEKSALIHESEDHTRQLEIQYEAKLKKYEDTFNEKLLSSQQELMDEHEKAMAASAKRIAILEKEVEQHKVEDMRNKQRIGESELEIGRLDSTLNETQETLDESERVRTRLEKEFKKVSELTKKLGEVERERDLLKQQQTQSATKGIRELEKLNRELRDENDELQSEIEMLRTQAKSGVKRNRSHRRRTTDRVSRVGSVLSDYTKPVIIKRNKDGMTSSDSDHETVDGKPASVVRVSGDGGSNEEENAAIKSEQQKTIKELEGQLLEREGRLKALENTIRQLEQNIKAKDGSINKQKSTLEKIKKECKDKDVNIKEKTEIIEQMNGDLKIQEGKVREYETSIAELRSVQKESDVSKKQQETTMRNLRAEVESLKNISTSESSELKDRFNKELSNLTAQFTTEIEEMQLRFSTEKDEMQQSYLDEKQKLESEFDAKYKQQEQDFLEKHRNAISELKAEFGTEKERLVSEHNEEKSELEKEFNKQKLLLEKFYKDEIEKELSKHGDEIRRFEEIVDVLREEKKQIQDFSEKEKGDIAEQFTAEKAEIEKEKVEMEKSLLAELQKERERFVSERTNSVADYEEVKRSLEEKFIRDKKAIEKSCQERCTQLEKTVKELRQVFDQGEEGLKGKLKEDFVKCLSEHKRALENENDITNGKLEDLKTKLVNKDIHIDELQRQVSILEGETRSLRNELEIQKDESRTSTEREREILDAEMSEQLAAHENVVENLKEEINLLSDENIKLKERVLETDNVEELELARQQILELNSAIEEIKEGRNEEIVRLEESLEEMRAQKVDVVEKNVELSEAVARLENENVQLKKSGEQSKSSPTTSNSWRCTQLERKLQNMENDERELKRQYDLKENENKKEIVRLKALVHDLQDSLNRRSEKVMLAEKARKELLCLEETVGDMENERKILENTLYQQNIKNTSLQDEVADLKRRNLNAENRYKKELENEREKVNLIKTEMSTVRSKHLRELDEVRERLDRALSNNERDQAMRDKILNDAKVEILTLSNKLEEKAKVCRNLEDERSSWGDKVRLLDRQRREMELRVKKAHETVDERVTHLNKQLEESHTRSIKSDTLVQELYVENARLTKTVQEVEAAQKKAEKTNRQLQEQKRALQRVISKLCGANALA